MFDEGKGSEFFVDSDGSVFTSGPNGGFPQKIWVEGEGWKAYAHGFNPFVTNKVSEDEAKVAAGVSGE